MEESHGNRKCLSNKVSNCNHKVTPTFLEFISVGYSLIYRVFIRDTPGNLLSVYNMAFQLH
ncbi:uncharacterized protein LOC119649192 isoform X2 [Hermetia illucens]|uniref:uncharacterized protein LOC119649192 isoform X2 n=1 Tax=Hermetia illucens TaxID=343691 RepID=UPI0018CC769C|nr:uncharacterized protein LOC119649192 isoform X2 [Hermetia illucens]